MIEPETTTADTKTAKPETYTAKTVRPNGRERVVEVEEKPLGPPKTIIREYFESAVVTVIMALFGMTFIVQAVKVPTASMENTITVGDHLLVNKFIFAPGPRFMLLPQREIKRSDIIVFKYPGNPFDPERDKQEDNIPYKVNYVKRVIGLPGDTIEVKGLKVYVNGEPLPEHIIVARNTNDKGPLEIGIHFKVTEEPFFDHIFSVKRTQIGTRADAQTSHFPGQLGRTRRTVGYFAIHWRNYDLPGAR